MIKIKQFILAALTTISFGSLGAFASLKKDPEFYSYIFQRYTIEADNYLKTQSLKFINISDFLNRYQSYAKKQLANYAAALALNSGANSQNEVATIHEALETSSLLMSTYLELLAKSPISSLFQEQMAFEDFENAMLSAEFFLATQRHRLQQTGIDEFIDEAFNLNLPSE